MRRHDQLQTKLSAALIKYLAGFPIPNPKCQLALTSSALSKPPPASMVASEPLAVPIAAALCPETDDAAAADPSAVASVYPAIASAPTCAADVALACSSPLPAAFATGLDGAAGSGCPSSIGGMRKRAARPGLATAACSV